MTSPDQPLLEFAEVMRRLRAECPWKAGQTHRSLARYLLEETHETLEAIDTGDLAHLREELGDLLLQVYFHAVIAEEEGAFTLDDVAADIVAKMHRRNPHVFGEGGGPDHGLSAQQVDEAWEAVKAGEKQRSSATEGIAPTLPALLLATKVLERTERVAEAGATRPAGASETDTPEDIGAALLAVVRRARAAGVDPEQALRDAVRGVVGD